MAKNYLDNEEFTKEILSYQKTGIVSERLGQILLDLHKNILYSKNLYNLSEQDKQTFMSDSLYLILKTGLKTFNPKKGKAFSYFTRAIYLNVYSALKKQRKYYDRFTPVDDFFQEKLDEYEKDGIISDYDK